MRDPGEGVAADGTITTGVARSRVPQPFEAVLSMAVEAIAETGCDAAAYLYGSVATGQARRGQSDVDLLTVGPGPGLAAELSHELSGQFGHLCQQWIGDAPPPIAEQAGLLPAVTGQRVLDIACGQGRISRYLARLGADVTRIDISASAVHGPPLS